MEKSVNIIYHISKQKYKNQAIISKDTENSFDKIQHAFLIKALRKLGIEGSFLDLTKTFYKNKQKNPTANVIYIYIFFFNIYIFIWLHRVLVAVCEPFKLWHVGSSSLTMGRTLAPPALGAQSLIHWATRKVPRMLYLMVKD